MFGIKELKERIEILESLRVASFRFNQTNKTLEDFFECYRFKFAKDVQWELDILLYPIQLQFKTNWTLSYPCFFNYREKEIYINENTLCSDIEKTLRYYQYSKKALKLDKIFKLIELDKQYHDNWMRKNY